MKIKNTIAALGLFSVIAFGASAAESVNNAQTNSLTDMGTISVSGITGAPSEITQALADKADSKGATAYKIIEMRQENGWHATAKIYK